MPPPTGSTAAHLLTGSSRIGGGGVNLNTTPRLLLPAVSCLSRDSSDACRSHTHTHIHTSQDGGLSWGLSGSQRGNRTGYTGTEMVSVDIFFSSLPLAAVGGL